MFACPVCRRPFPEAGFCPFDGHALAAAPQSAQLTQVDIQLNTNMALAAQSSVELPVDKRKLTALGHMPAADSGRSKRPSEGLLGTQKPREGEAVAPTAPSLPPVTSAGQVAAATSHAAAHLSVAAAAPSAAGPAPALGYAATPYIAAGKATLGEHEEALTALPAVVANEYDYLVGQLLDGRYHIQSKIGEGGMGVVFAARHVVIERPLAIKVLRHQVMRDAATIKRFEREAKAASRIGHPNIVDVTDFGMTADGVTYSVMEFVQGETLARVNRAQAPLALARVLKIALQMARALQAAHDKGIVHRDLKPDNVFLTTREKKPDVVKIVDFGIAKVQPLDGTYDGPKLTKAGSIFGTPEYMAPEQATGQDADSRVDIYALGIIMYEMATGRLPHKGETASRTIALQIIEKPVPPSQWRGDLPPQLEAIILRAMAKRREDRYQTMAELAAALEVIRDELQLLATSATSNNQPLALAAAEARLATSKPRTRGPSGAPQDPRVEPQFVARQPPANFEHVFVEDELPAGPRRWPWAIAALLVLGGGVLAAIMWRGGAPASGTGPVVDAPRLVVDASPGVVPPVVDAAPGVPVGPPAMNRPKTGRIPAGQPRAASPGLPATPNGRGTHFVTVLTQPEGGAVYVGDSYRGPGGVTLEEAVGQRLPIRCTLPGYKPGMAEAVFDGHTDAVLCVMTRIKICIDGIKNPFDDCQPPPARP